MTYQELRNILTNIKNENKYVDSLILEFERFSKLIELEKMKKNIDVKRIEAIENHLSTINITQLFTYSIRELIIDYLTKISDVQSTIIYLYFFENKSYAEIEIKTHYPVTTIKKYLERGINSLCEVFNNENNND